MTRKLHPVVTRRARCNLCRADEHACYACVELKRSRNREAAARKRMLSKPVRKCFRCLTHHAVGERYCPIAAEYDPPGTDELERSVLGVSLGGNGE